MSGSSYDPNPYRELLERKENRIPIYYDIRCGLVHSYATNKDCTVNMGDGKHGVCYDDFADHYDFNIKTYFKEFKCAVER